MSLAHIRTVGRIGIRCFSITIEVDVSPGLPGFTIVGLPDTIVQESKERIRSAIKNSGATFPLSRITVNLAPASVPKEGIGFDLPIAVGVLVASEQLLPPNPDTYFYGELGLQGELKRTKGVLPFVLNAKEAKQIFIPLVNRLEGGLGHEGRVVYGITTLQELIHIFHGEKTANPIEPINIAHTPAEPPAYDFADITGQAAAKRALEIAASGHHNILLRGSPGAGKTLLARTLPSIMPLLTREELLETTQIYSITGLLGEDKAVMSTRPFRAPHHSTSLVAMVGGSNPPRPGEITLAHNGVLFLDEFAELPRSVIEALRQPLEDRIITVARAGYSAEFPAHCLLVAAINPCPCGYKDDPKRICTCSPSQILLYQKKLSGPILDRIDMHILVPPVPVEQLTKPQSAEPSQHIRRRVNQARQRQQERYKQLPVNANSQLNSKDIHTYCAIDEQAQALLEQAMIKLNLSARSYHKVLKTARTIADLAGQEHIPASAVAEALQYRPAI